MEAFARVPMEVNVNKMEVVFVEKDLVEMLVQFVCFFSNDYISIVLFPETHNNIISFIFYLNVFIQNFI